MDLSTIDTKSLAEEGVPMHLHGPNGAPLMQEDEKTPITITLLGDDSDALTKLDRATTNAHLRGNGVVTAELAEAKHLTRLARATVGWSGIVVDGKELEFSEEAARELYKRFKWIRGQAAVFISDRANFSKASPES